MPTKPAWDVIYARDADDRVQAIEFLDECPDTIQDRFDSILDDVALGPPLKYRGGGYWEAMGDVEGVDMTGWFEARADGPGREHFRLFCLLDNGTPEERAELGLPRPAIAVINGGRKAFQTKFPASFYRAIQEQGVYYRAQRPRRIAEPDADERTLAEVVCSDEAVTVTMVSGSTYSLPLFGRLITASDDERALWTCASDQSVIYWPRVNEQRAVSDFFDRD